MNVFKFITCDITFKFIFWDIYKHSWSQACGIVMPSRSSKGILCFKLTKSLQIHLMWYNLHMYKDGEHACSLQVHGVVHAFIRWDPVFQTDSREEESSNFARDMRQHQQSDSPTNPTRQQQRWLNRQTNTASALIKRGIWHSCMRGMWNTYSGICLQVWTAASVGEHELRAPEVVTPAI